MFNDARCDNLDFSKADITVLQFQGADLTGAILKGKSLVGCGFYASKLHGTDLSDCDLTQACFINASLQGVKASNVIGYQMLMIEAHLSSCDFQNLDAQESNFSKSTISECNFSGSTLTYADFSHANITNSLFNRCELFMAKSHAWQISDVMWDLSNNEEMTGTDQALKKAEDFAVPAPTN
jgi:uncharacterized protein YjbI with pentapeptide repeats